jgi:hypothetical protein
MNRFLNCLQQHIPGHLAIFSNNSQKTLSKLFHEEGRSLVFVFESDGQPVGINWMQRL